MMMMMMATLTGDEVNEGGVDVGGEDVGVFEAEAW